MGMLPPRVLMIGAGGLGSAAALVLARSLSFCLTLIDDDLVELSNLHRQLLYTEDDIGKSKLDVAAQALMKASRAEGHELRIESIDGRFRPSNAMELAESHDVVIEGADNLPTKFLAADACKLAGTPVVQAGAVRWHGWAMASASSSPCMRCVFEDIPQHRVETCAEAGVIGPVVGAMGGLQAALTLKLLGGNETAYGALWHFDGLSGRLRRIQPTQRADCPLCEGKILNLNPERYQNQRSPTIGCT